MNIPLDCLYHYIEKLAEKLWQDCVLIYRFYPHGSKDLKHLTFLNDHHSPRDFVVCPYIYCNDQEPLDYKKYDQETHLSSSVVELMNTVGYNKINLRDYPIDIWDQAVLVHSEKRSSNVDLYNQNGFVTVYYWSHAVIARDWFRYAQHVSLNKQVTTTFLIYNRAWSGTREYRLKFSEWLIRLGLDSDCCMRISPIDSTVNQHYDLYTFKNPDWRPAVVIEDFFPTCIANSHYSADFDLADYEATDIEVVLETLFDDDRLHLTEKILRPIALGQPFILAGTPGSLEYLKSYGFKTFGHVWDERYDQEIDSQERLLRIADLMKQIANWSPVVRERKIAQAKKIAEHNRQHFFSKEFFDLVTNELTTNLGAALDTLKNKNTSSRWLDNQEFIWSSKTNDQAPVLKHLTDQDWAQIINVAKTYNLKHSS
jgi:hypothetical protein